MFCLYQCFSANVHFKTSVSLMLQHNISSVLLFIQQRFIAYWVAVAIKINKTEPLLLCSL